MSKFIGNATVRFVSGEHIDQIGLIVDTDGPIVWVKLAQNGKVVSQHEDNLTMAITSEYDSI